MPGLRCHKAVHENNLKLLKEASRNDLDSRDEDGMTCAHWACHYGNVDCLRVLAGRGSDLGLADLWGSTCLHFAARNNHMNCVTFLVNFGCNLWAVDNEGLTAMDVAGLSGRAEVVKFLDAEMNKEQKKNPKTVERKKAKTAKECEKRIAKLEKINKNRTQRLANASASTATTVAPQPGLPEKSTEPAVTTADTQLKPTARMSKAATLSNLSAIPANGSTDNSSRRESSGASKRFHSIERKLKQTLRLAKENKLADLFAKEDGSKRSLTYSHYVRPSDAGGRLKIPKVFSSSKGAAASATSTISSNRRRTDSAGAETLLSITGENGDVLFGACQPSPSTAEHANGDESASGKRSETVGLFERPGFGSMAFRTLPSATTLLNMDRPETNSNCSRVLSDGDDGFNDLSDDDQITPLETFLEACGVAEFMVAFTREKITLESLLYLTEDDLCKLQLPMGPRKILNEAIRRRKHVIEDPGPIYDMCL